MRNLLLIILFILLFSFDNLEISLKTRTEVTDNIIRIEDVVMQSNLPNETFDKIKDIPIRTFSEDETYCNLTSDFIKKQLDFYQFEGIEIKGGICTVYKQKNFIEDSEIIKMAKKTILSHLNEKDEDCNIIIKNIPKIIVPDNDFKIILNVSHEIKRSGLVYLSGKIESKKTIINRFKIMADVNVFKEVVTLKIPKRRDERIFEEDLKIERKQVQDIAETCFEKSEVIGKHANKYLAKGKVITFKDIKKSPDVKRGQKVDIEVISGPVLLSYEAVSKQNGYIGDIIRCQNPASKETFFAEITGHNKLVISLEEK